MRAKGEVRLIFFGAAGFGIGWALLGIYDGGFAIVGGVGTPMFGALFSGDFLALLVYPLVFSVGGAFAGAVLGLGLREERKAVLMALLGGVGVFIGSFIATIIYFLVSWGLFGAGYGILEALSAATLGLVVGALLSLSVRSFGGTVVLALMGLVGFGIGGVIAAALQGFPLQPSEGLPSLQTATFGAIEGIIGGASLGAALGYLERRKLAQERRPRVR
jgi:MFS family permease